MLPASISVHHHYSAEKQRAAPFFRRPAACRLLPQKANFPESLACHYRVAKLWTTGGDLCQDSLVYIGMCGSEMSQLMPMLKALASFVVFFAPQKQRDGTRRHPSLRWKTVTPCSTVQLAAQQKNPDLKSSTCTSCGWLGCSTRLPPPKLGDGWNDSAETQRASPF